jgi:thiol-disulfide isomerase/thioredoxin
MMMSQLLMPLACTLLIPGLALAQGSGNYCEPAPALREELRKVANVYDEDLSFKVRIERQKTMLQELLSKYPDDLFVQRRYQDNRRAGFFADTDALLADYRAQMEKKPNDPIAVYLYVRMLIGRNTKEAIALAEKLTQQAPDFPWTQLQLAEIYNYVNFRDVAKSKDHLKQWIAKCPNETASLSLLSRVGDKEMMTAAAQRLRTRLASSTSNEDLGYWENLWTLSFKVKPVPEHPQLRQEIAEDLKQIRARNLNTKEWFQALQAGYKQVGDKSGERWAQDELVRLFPKSQTAKRMVQSRHYEEHPYPKGDEPEAKRQAYNQALLAATTEWLKQWPDDESSWSARVRSLIALEGSNTDVEAAYKGYAKAHEQEGSSYSLPPIEVSVTRFYLKRGFRLQDIPTLLQKGLTEIEQIEKSSGTSDLYTRGEEVESNLSYTRWESWPILAEAYARTKQPVKAREVLAQMAGALKQKEPRDQAKDSQKRAYAYYQGIYWQAVAKVADAEQRKLDALMAYQNVLALRSNSSSAKSTDKDELSDNVQRLWKALGGTEQGWSAYLARPDSKLKPAAAEVATWDAKSTALPEFDLTDLQGRRWSHADLKGKVTLINFWATWCGPCRQELPYVQKLREQLKDRKDVMVLTLNIDEEVGMVEPFMKENKYTFPVLLGQAYASSQGVNSIPRNWIVSLDGKVMFEGIGFANDGEEFIKKATQAIEKVKGPN